MQFLITAIVAVVLLVGMSSSCLSGCSCISYLNGLHVTCSSRGLHSIPGNLPTNTFVLYLQQNRITSIKSNTFNNFLKLVQLHLDDNEISVIEDNNFNNLPKLEILYLHNNKITSIKSDTFSNLTNLKTLYLQNNPISVVEENAFYNLPNLELKFHMYCTSCDNIPFWRWLRRQLTFTTYIYCNDFHGVRLSKIRNFNDSCTANDGNGSVWCSRHGDWTCLVYMFFMISLQYIMSNI